MTALEPEIARWSARLRRHRGVAPADVAELEEHLRDRIADLVAGGLDEDEAFLIAVKRMGRVDAIAREFAQEHADRLWKQLVLSPEADQAAARPGGTELAVVLGLAVVAALLSRTVVQGLAAEHAARCAPLLVAPFLAAYFAWKRDLAPRVSTALAGVAAVLAVVANAYPYDDGGSTGVLTIVHLPVVLWFLVGIAYAGGDWRSHQQRMHFVRFTGEWVVYYTLLALGGGVLVGLRRRPSTRSAWTRPRP